jgi:DNA-binding winged helix-turn-helix (wHTH) protein
VHPLRLRLGVSTVDLATGRGIGPRGPFTLSPNEIALLTCLAEHPGEAVSREALQVRALGYSPVSLSRAVDAAVSRIRAKTEPQPATPVHLHTVYGTGYRLDAEPDGDPVPAEHDPEAPLGRDPAIADLVERLRAAGRVSLAGPPGIGRTTVAGAVARRLRADLVVRVTHERAATTLLRARGAAGAASFDAATASLSGRLVVLDDLDRAPDADRVLARLEEVGARVLATGRVVSWGGPVSRLAPLGPELARALVRRVRTAAGAPEVPGVDALADTVGGNPGALVYFARRSLVVAPDLLARRLPVGGAGSELADERAREILDWAWAVLLPEERDAVLRLVPFRGAFDAEAAASVWGRPPGDTFDRLAALEGVGVLARRGARFEVHPLLRLAAGGLPASGDARARWRSWAQAEATWLAAAPPTLPVTERAHAATGDLQRSSTRPSATGTATPSPPPRGCSPAPGSGPTRRRTRSPSSIGRWRPRRTTRGCACRAPRSCSTWGGAIGGARTSTPRGPGTTPRARTCWRCARWSPAPGERHPPSTRSGRSSTPERTPGGPPGPGSRSRRCSACSTARRTRWTPA